jgi:hypothetical protein
MRVLDKTIDKIRVKIRHLSGREGYVMDRFLPNPATIDPMRVSVPAARCASNTLDHHAFNLRPAIERVSALIVTNDE